MQPSRAAAAGSPSGTSAKSLDWAREPVRRPGFVASIAALLVSISLGAPSWVAILAGVLLVLVGTVGRADDARRWRRLRHGGVRPNDNSRMWAFLPKYFLASLLFSGLTLLVGGLLWALMINGGGYVLGLLDGSTPLFLSTMSTGHRLGLLSGPTTILYLLLIWFMPWGAPNRRGAAHTIEVVTKSDSVRLVLVVVMLAAALGFLILFLLDALPWQTFEPIISAMS
jgi:non-specific serine/threonine protein kinase